MSASTTVSSNTDEICSDVLDVSLKDLKNRPLRRFKRYPAYKNSGIEWLDEIPDRWTITKLKRLCQFAYGDSLASEVRLEGEIAVYGSNGRVGMHTYANSLAPCLVIGRKGSFGKVNYSTRPVFAIDTAFLVDSRFTNADMRWLYYVLSDARLDSATKDSAIPGLDREDAYARELCLCSAAEQRAIASFLDRQTAKIDALVAKKERLIQLLQEKRTALIVKAITKGLDSHVPMKDSGFEWLRSIPSAWEVGHLRRFWSVFDCKHRTAVYVADGFPIVNTTEVKPGSLSLDGPRKVTTVDFKDLAEGHRRPKKGDVIYSRNASLGSAAYVATDTPFCMGQDVCLITSKADQLYLAYQLNSPVILAQLEAVSVGSTFERINISKIKGLIVARPPDSEQLEIAAFVNGEATRIDKLTIKITEAIEKLTEFRGALISAAVTGKIDVREEVP